MRKSLLFTVFILLVSVATANSATGPVDFTGLVKSAGPAVVNINTEKTVQMRSRGNFPFPMPFDEFFKGMPGYESAPKQAPRKRKQSSLGSGFLISSDGFIVTNHHVIDGADSISVSFGDRDDKEKTFKATLIGSDKITDLALLKIDAKNLPFLKFGNSDALEVGEWVLAIGNPFGLDHTVTAGILSAKGRSLRSNPFDSFLQTDASINPGNSGGPLLNMAGEVIGINAAIIANGQGIGFAIPSNMAKEIIATLQTDKKISRGWIGVSIQTLDENGAKALGLDDTKGALVGEVHDGHPAAKGGMQAGDVIMAVNGAAVENSSDLSRKIAALKPGDTAKIKVWRNGEEKTLSIKLTERETEKAQKAEEGSVTDDSLESLGLGVRNLSADDARRLRLKDNHGVLIVAVDGGKSAGEAGLRAGDVIITANNTPIQNVDDLTDVIEKQGKKRGAVMLQILRGGQRFFKAVTVSSK